MHFTYVDTYVVTSMYYTHMHNANATIGNIESGHARTNPAPRSRCGRCDRCGRPVPVRPGRYSSA